MSALVLPRQQPSLRLNWQRVTALSGTASVHALILMLLLVPQGVVKLVRPVADPIIVNWIEPPPKPKEIPVDPVPPQIKHKQDVQKLPTPVPVQPPPVTDVSTSNPGPYVPPGPETGPVDIGEPVETAPSALSYNTRTKVRYPKDALLKREHGTVKLRVLVGVDGLPQTVEIESSSGSRSLDNAARDAVKKWTFQAGTRNGVAYAAWASISVKFDFSEL